MTSFPSVECKVCGEEFETQIKIDPAIYKMVPSLTVGENSFACPHCDSRASYSEADFRYTEAQAQELARFGKIVSAFIEAVGHEGKPLQAASELLEELESLQKTGDTTRFKSSSKFAALKKWIPDSPEKVAAYIVIAQMIYQLLIKEPDAPLNRDFIINNIDQSVIVQIREEPGHPPIKADRKVGRNELCPCGSGKKFKKCHGQL